MNEREIFLKIIESIAITLRNDLSGKNGLHCVAFYGKPLREGTDLDVLIVDDGQQQPAIVESLQRQSTLHKVTLDAWILTPEKLNQRMRRIAGVSSGLPPIHKTATAWSGFGFVPVVGHDYLTTVITHSYSNPQSGGPIPPTPEERKVFRPK